MEQELSLMVQEEEEKIKTYQGVDGGWGVRGLGWAGKGLARGTQADYDLYREMVRYSKTF
jgi:hypothetical protein